MQDFAETTMNELLGWYGYTDKVDQHDTAQLTLTSYRPSSTSPTHRKAQRGDDDDAPRSEENGKEDEKQGEAEGGEDGRDARSCDSLDDSEQDTGRLSELVFSFPV